MIGIKTIPEPAYIETTDLGQHLSLDFMLENPSDQDWTIQQVDVSVFDPDNQLVLRRTLNTNGIRPAIQILGERVVEKQSQLCVFNPFHTFPMNLRDHQLCYVFSFASQTGDTCTSRVTVSPEVYVTQTDLCLPMRGRLIVLDGHDFYAHHRRVDLLHPFLVQHMGLKSNSGRFAYDFCPVDARGDAHSGEGRAETDWYGLREPVYAPGAGTIAAIQNDMQDNILGEQEFDFALAAENPDSIMGNHVLIDHLNGEYSLLAHLQQGSIRVRQGAAVPQGQEIGLLGFSGSTGPWVHLHYELRTGTDLRTARGLPAYFSFDRILGSTRTTVERGYIGTGYIVGK